MLSLLTQVWNPLAWVCLGGLRFIDRRQQGSFSGFKPIIGPGRRCKGLHMAAVHKPLLLISFIFERWEFPLSLIKILGRMYLRLLKTFHSILACLFKISQKSKPMLVYSSIFNNSKVDTWLQLKTRFEIVAMEHLREPPNLSFSSPPPSRSTQAQVCSLSERAIW